MIQLQKGDEIVEVESTNEFAIERWKLRGYEIIS